MITSDSKLSESKEEGVEMAVRSTKDTDPASSPAVLGIQKRTGHLKGLQGKQCSRKGVFLWARKPHLLLAANDELQMSFLIEIAQGLCIVTYSWPHTKKPKT